MAVRVMIMAGGTGGHVFPALAVAEVLRNQGCQVDWLGVPESFESRTVPKYGFPIHWIKARRFRGQGKKAILMAPVYLTLAMWQAAKVLRSVKPDVVLGMGGFVTAPGGVVTRLMGLPLVIHEQNAVPGMSNRWLGKIASSVLQAFPGSFAEKYRAKLIGNPVRENIINLPSPEERFNDREGCKLLVIGGSLGALVLNETVPDAIAVMEKETRPEVWHQAGKGKLEMALAAYEKAGVKAKVSEFVDDMDAAYQWADLIICRAGALTVAELAAVGLPAILVPYPHAVDDHQTKNASHLQVAGAGVIIPQSELTAKYLAEILEPIVSSAETRLAMAKKGKKLAKPHAAEDVANECLRMVAA